MTSNIIQTLTKLIIANALEDKSCRGLIIAYTEEYKHLCEYEDDVDLDTAMPVVEGLDACDKVMSDEFIRCYKAALDHQVDTETCLDVFEYPQEWAYSLTEVPRRLLTLVGRAMAKRDAQMANDVRRQVMARS